VDEVLSPIYKQGGLENGSGMIGQNMLWTNILSFTPQIKNEVLSQYYKQEE
jgi:hypothetical protein